MENVSIVIPAIKWEAFSEKCVTTCARLFPSATLILVLDECSPLALSFDNLIVLYGITGTISKKRNVGVEAAKTEFIAFIDSDAFPHSAWLSSAVKTLESKTNVGLLGGPNISPLEQESERNLVGLACKSWLVAGKWNFYKSEKSTARYCDNLPSCNLVLRKEMYEALNGMSEQMEVGEDTDFCARLLASGFQIYFNPESIVYHFDRKIVPYMKQRIVRGAGVYLHIFGVSAQKKNIYTYILLQPVATLLFFLSFPLAFYWQPWCYFMAICVGIYALLILVESLRWSISYRNIPLVALLIFVGNILPGVGFLLKGLRRLPSLQYFYRND